jgi:hypothetical protein
VSHYGLGICIKKHLKAKEELCKLKYFTMQKYTNLQTIPIKETKGVSIQLAAATISFRSAQNPLPGGYPVRKDFVRSSRGNPKKIKRKICGGDFGVVEVSVMETSDLRSNTLGRAFAPAPKSLSPLRPVMARRCGDARVRT